MPLLLLLLVVGAGAGPAFAQAAPEAWSIGFGTLAAPFDTAAGATAMRLSPDGHVLVMGLNNGGVLFVNATTGVVIDSAMSDGHGIVQRIVTDGDGQTAAIIYADGYTGVVAIGEDTPLLERFKGNGAPAEIQSLVNGALSLDGQWLVTTGDGIRLFRHTEGEGGNASVHTFEEVDAVQSDLGPFLYMHPMLKVFGVLSPDGRLAIYTYGPGGLQPVKVGEVGSSETGRIVALGASGDGSRFAVAYDDGAVRRYRPVLASGASEDLVLDFTAQLRGTPNGLFLDQTGERILAWSEREALWAHGRNRNAPAQEVEATDRDTVHVFPELQRQFRSLAASADLTRMLTRESSTAGGPLRGAEVRTWNLPEQDSAPLASVEDSNDPLALAGAGTIAVVADDDRVQALRVTRSVLPPPGLGGGAAEGDGAVLFGLGLTTLIIAGVGVVVLLLIIVLVPLALRDGTEEGEAPPPLAADEGPRYVAPLAGASGGVVPPGRLPSVAASAPAASALPDGFLVLQDVVIHATPLPPLSLVVPRAQVLRVHGDARWLIALREALTGKRPFHGRLAAGGADAEETGVLYARRVQIGLHPGKDTQSAEDLFRADGARRGEPASLVERRLAKDLAWMGSGRQVPLGQLRPFDRWKARMALTVAARPKVTVLSLSDLPDQPPDRAGRRTWERVIGEVLRGVSRYYGTLVVLLDDGIAKPAVVRRWAHEEVRLGLDGLGERNLLREGRPIGAPDSD